jgi:hypothetical protein
MPAAEDADAFYRIDFTNHAARSIAPLELKQRLEKATPPSWVKLVEVYRLDPSIYFYNDTALLLSQEYGIDVPRDGAQRMTRADFSAWGGISIFIKWPLT